MSYDFKKPIEIQSCLINQTIENNSYDGIENNIYDGIENPNAALYPIEFLYL